MKAKIFIGITLLFIGGSFPVFAQSTAYASISATIVAPVGFSKTTDMSFNDVIVSIKNGIVSANSINEVKISGVKPEQNGTATLASFSVTDSNHSTFHITLPTENILIGDGNSNLMIVSNFSCTHTHTVSLQGMGSEIKVGANLHITENQSIINNNSQKSFPVTLNYN